MTRSAILLASSSVASARAAAAKKVAREYWADNLPSLTGIFRPVYQNPPTLTTPRTGWQAQLVLSFPFYDGGFRYGVQYEREALASESQLALEASLRQVQSEVRASFEALGRADAALAAAQSSATLAQEALALANQASQILGISDGMFAMPTSSGSPVFWA